MNCALVVQTCDKYEPYWAGFFNFMKKHWAVDMQKYFCNEEKTLDLPDGFKQIKSGKGTFVQNLKSILDSVDEENVFYMLEDFWPTAPMTDRMFKSLYEAFRKENMDALQVSCYLPYYSLSKSDISADGIQLLEFSKNSEWLFNFQARFWRKGLLRNSLFEPLISESTVSSAITVEEECDKRWRGQNLNVFLRHYHWYPIGGVAYRGEFTETGKQMENDRLIDSFVAQKFNLQF